MALACPLYTLDLGDFAAFHFQERSAVSRQIATHLMQQLASCSHGERCSSILPSVMTLSGFYGCGVLDVLDALPILKQHSYDYRLEGLDGPISVQDLKGHKRPLHHYIHWPTHF